MVLVRVRRGNKDHLCLNALSIESIEPSPNPSKLLRCPKSGTPHEPLLATPATTTAARWFRVKDLSWRTK